MPTTPNVKTITAEFAAVAAGADGETEIGEAPFAGTVTRVSVVPSATITGAATNNRTHQVTNRGAAGSGVAVVASRAYANGTNSPANLETAVALSGTPANLVVAQGDVLSFESTHVGTGIADPGGLIIVEITRGDVSS